MQALGSEVANAGLWCSVEKPKSMLMRGGPPGYVSVLVVENDFGLVIIHFDLPVYVPGRIDQDKSLRVHLRGGRTFLRPNRRRGHKLSYCRLRGKEFLRNKASGESSGNGKESCGR
jgi:hypothetical protein